MAYGSNSNSSSSSNIFFLSWELWQQMTFVLAMAIVAVFGLGLAKLWWNNRLMLKQEVLDEEKRVRVEEMRRTGIPIKRANDIPFGVRAIQKGVEVDGIWISRPASLVDNKEKHINSSSTTTTLAGGGHQGLSGSTTPVPTPLSKFSTRQAVRSNSGAASAAGLNEDTLRRLEGQGSPSSAPVYDTYVPSSYPPHPRRQGSASSESVASGKSYSTSSSRNSQRLYMATTSNHHHDGRNGPMPVRVQAPSGYVSHITSQQQEAALATVEPTFGPGDLHLNRSSRKVNSGFEILPAGTFGSVAGMGLEGGEDAERRGKLMKRAE